MCGLVGLVKAVRLLHSSTGGSVFAVNTGAFDFVTTQR